MLLVKIKQILMNGSKSDHFEFLVKDKTISRDILLLSKKYNFEVTEKGKLESSDLFSLIIKLNSDHPFEYKAPI